MPIRNLDKLKAKLAKVPPKVRANIVKASDQNADQMVTLAKRLAPIRSGSLVASVHKEDSPSKLGKQVVAGGPRAFYARFVEFGNPRRQHRRRRRVR